jgi:RNA polymerase sigma factor (sigma-70 family)
LVIGIRERDSRALRAFVERFLPVLLEQARRLHVADGERVTTVTSFLDDIMMSLVKLDPPRALSSYVITSFRRCIAATYRRESAIERQAERQVEDMGASRVIGGSCSEFMLRAAASPDADDASSTVQGSALLRDLMASCTVDERQLLVWMSYRVPLRDCASWLGISYESARQRVSRLRARLKREGAAILAASSTPDRDVLVRILARSGMRQCDNKPEESEA